MNCRPPRALPPLPPAGLLIAKKGGEVIYTHGEKTFGDHAPLEEVVAEAEKAGGSK